MMDTPCQANCKCAAVHAAGIARSIEILRHESSERQHQYQTLIDRHGGYIGVVEVIAIAAIAMAEYCPEGTAGGTEDQDDERGWGAELPHVYEAWAIVAAMLLNAADGEPGRTFYRESVLNILGRS